MSDYQRNVYYLYNYENGQKRNNVGFTRVEQLHGKCRMTSRICVPSMNGKMLQVCLFIRKHGEMQFLPVGNMQVNNMTGENKSVFYTDNILGMGYQMADIKGMVIYDSCEKFFGSEWDDQSIIFHEFKLAEEKEPEQEQTLSAASCCDEDDVNMELEYTEQTITELPIEVDEEREIICEEAQEQDMTEEKSTECVEETEESLPRVFSQFPQINPFEDDEMTYCVRIEPQDIGRLPMESWVLANNSFLLHSYYSYRHLLLAKKHSEDGDEYVLCAPGICQNREQFMAAMFGFRDFKPAKKVANKSGEFGYWYMPVVMEA